MKYLCLIYEADEGLPSPTGARFRVRHGRPSLIDGPYDETSDVVAGFHLIEARDLNEAMQAAASLPDAPRRWVEVRPCRLPT